jgi:hypothetical protein
LHAPKLAESALLESISTTTDYELEKCVVGSAIICALNYVAVELNPLQLQAKMRTAMNTSIGRSSLTRGSKKPVQRSCIHMQASVQRPNIGRLLLAGAAGVRN